MAYGVVVSIQQLYISKSCLQVLFYCKMQFLKLICFRTLQKSVMSYVRTYKMILVWLHVICKGRIGVHAINSKCPFMQIPGLKYQIALLFVKREPCHIDKTLGHSLIVPRLPDTHAFTINVHVLRLWCYVVVAGRLSSDIDKQVKVAINNS